MFRTMNSYRNYKIYIDKTGLLEYLNESIGTPKNCIALSRARRFGKSHAAGMMEAYYTSKTVELPETPVVKLFDGFG